MHLNRAPDQNRHRIRKVERAWTAVYGLTRDANEAAESVNQSALSVRPSVPSRRRKHNQKQGYISPNMPCGPKLQLREVG